MYESETWATGKLDERILEVSNFSATDEYRDNSRAEEIISIKLRSYVMDWINRLGYKISTVPGIEPGPLVILIG